MSIQLIKSHQQTRGAFDNNRILERKPIAFPQEDPVVKPFSTLFYWAHAWSDEGGLIAEHPHRGFEICSFILTGSIEHYDSKQQKWIKLKAGDAQIIRSGNGISHAERLNPGGAIFQIWFDPDLEQSLQKPASYSDYAAQVFPVKKNNGVATKTIIGESSPFELETPVKVRQLDLDQGEQATELTPDYTAGAFLLEGQLEVGDLQLEVGDFLLVQGETAIHTTVQTTSRLFIVEVPDQAPYPTYTDRY